MAGHYTPSLEALARSGHTESTPCCHLSLITQHQGGQTRIEHKILLKVLSFMTMTILSYTLCAAYKYNGNQ